MTTSEASATPHVPGVHRQRGVRHAANLARQSLHIGLLAPPWISIPPPTYGGIEQVVELLARGLARRGHRVTMVAAPGSRIDGVEVITPLREPSAQIGLMPDDLLHCLAGVEALDKLGDVDVIIDHSGPMGGLLAARSGIPTLHVLHGPLTRPISAVYSAIVRHAPSLGLVAISEAQRRSAHEFPIAGVCHDGIDVTSAPFRDHDEGYLAFLGRMSPDKGAAEAIAVARAARRPILLAAKCREPQEKEYFERFIAPEFGPDVRWLGEIGPRAKYELLAGAQALVFPINWEEPFGLVMVEAMACGTPVLATPRGSVPEVVIDGVTGFVRDDLGELARCVEHLDEIDRRRCRAHVAQHFSASAMVDGYERLIHDTVRSDAQSAVRRPVKGGLGAARTGVGMRTPLPIAAISDGKPAAATA